MPDERQMGRESELVLSPGVYAYVLDQTKGFINTLTGPNKTSLSNTDQLVTFNVESGRFNPVSRQHEAIQTNVTAPKGQYVVLLNPSTTSKQPQPGKSEIMPVDGGLKMGQIENIPGPVSFPLWPGQNATVVLGHHLRSNQYLLVRVYDDEAAKANWDKSVVKSVSGVDAIPGDTEPEHSALQINKNALVTGQLLVIKGTEVAFYIPPTGIQVLKDEDDRYVRDAVTLERLEYSILLDEDGNKTYIRGPAVVFPEPTQQFVTSRTDENKRKFRAFELQETTGLHIKVIADYAEDGKEFKAGQELFITGRDQAIYYPRPEHAVISYGGNEKYFAIAIPGGEGRYVLDRKNGQINLVRGPNMFLPNPINEVVVRRILSESECRLYYPGNDEVVGVNRQYRNDSGTNGGEDVARSVASALGARSFLSADVAGSSFAALGAAPRETATKGTFGDALNRGSKYTPPRTITINSKYEGAVRVEVFNGYAIQVVNSSGDRKTIVGPQTILLEYDEKLERLSLSKGKPKNPDTRLDTVYLRYISNPVSDIITLKTKDLVNVSVHLKYLVRFDEAQKDLWFSIDNYVQYLVDHLRSIIGNAIRGIGVQTFYENATTILRDIVLGAKNAEKNERPLRSFTENGMQIYELELISIEVRDGEIATLLSKSRQEILQNSVELERNTEKLKLVQGNEAVKREMAQELADTQKLTDELNQSQAERAAQVRLAAVELDNSILLERTQGQKEVEEVTKGIRELALAVTKAEKDQEEVYEEARVERRIKEFAEEANAMKIKLGAVQPQFVEAIMAASQVGVLEKIAPYLAPLAIVKGESVSGALEGLLQGTPAEGLLENLKNLDKRRIPSGPVATA